MILTRSTPLSQPTGRPVVDLSNPITRGLIAASNGINGTHGINLSVVPTGVSNSGLVLKSPGGKGYRIPLIASVTSSEWTLVSKYSISTLSYQAGIGVYGSSSEFISQMPVVFPSHNLGCDANPYARDNASSGALQPNKEYALASVISASRNTIEHYIDGVLVGSSSLSSTSAITVNSVEVFAKNLTLDPAVAGATVGAFAVFNRALTSNEVRSLSLNPWQLFRPVQRRIYFDMVAGGGATGYALSADVGDYLMAGVDAALTYTPVSSSRSIVADAGVYSLSGGDALLPRGFAEYGEFGSYAASGQNASLKVSRLLAGDFGEYTLNGSDAALTASGAVAYNLAVDFGQYAITGVSASLIGPADQNADTHDGYFAKQWRKAAEQSKRKIEALEDQLEEIQEQIEEVKDAPEPKRPVLIESVPVPPFEAKAKIIEALIEQASRIRAEIDDEEVLLLL